MALNLKPIQALSGGVALAAVGWAAVLFGVNIFTKEFTKVFLEVDPGTSLTDCKIKVTPADAWIWTDVDKNDDRPVKVQWRVVKQQKGDYYWEFTTVGAASPVKPDNIDCGKHKEKGGTTTTQSVWEYSLKVYACDGNQKTDTIVCEKDPKVHVQG